MRQNLVYKLYSWNPVEAPVISNVNMDIEGDKLVMIIGAVGSGKVRKPKKNVKVVVIVMA